MGYLTLKPEQVNAFFRLMDQRGAREHDHHDQPLVDALLNRLRHHCITIRIDGPSLHEPAPVNAQPTTGSSLRDVRAGTKCHHTRA